MIRATLILAGGSGKRLWPASTERNPKQYLTFDDGHSYMWQSLLRAKEVKSDIVVIITSELRMDTAVRQCEEVGFPTGTIYIIGEPDIRNTAAAITLGVQFVVGISGQSPEEVLLLVMPSDHAIEPPDAFARDVAAAHQLAKKGWLVTFGVPPVRPETGYGYIKTGEPLPPGNRVASFVEKPDVRTATDFLKEGGFLWNVGIFVFPLPLFLSEMQTHAADIMTPLSTVSFPSPVKKNGLFTVAPDAALHAVYRTVPSIAIDRALMEQSERVAVVPASFGWSDVGSWDEIAKIHEGDSPVAAVQAQNNTVFSDLPVALAGVEGLIVVVKNGVVLIVGKEHTQLVRDVVEEVSKKRKDLL